MKFILLKLNIKINYKIHLYAQLIIKYYKNSTYISKYLYVNKQQLVLFIITTYFKQEKKYVNEINN